MDPNRGEVDSDFVHALGPAGGFYGPRDASRLFLAAINSFCVETGGILDTGYVRASVSP